MAEVMNMNRNGSSQTADPVIRNGLLETALEYARRKQLAIYSRSRQPEVLQQWYLAELTAEYMRICALSVVAMNRGKNLNMEKEHPVRPGHPSSNHIVTDSKKKINS